MKKIFTLMIVCILMSVLFALPAYASCDTCLSQEVDIDWAAHCEAACSCSRGPCPDCGETGYIEDFCSATHEYAWSHPSDTSHEGVCACGKVVEGDCSMNVALHMEFCDEPGQHVEQCTVCGRTNSETLPIKGHTWVKVSQDDPSCSVKGKEYFTCTVCGHTKTEDIATIEHTWETTTREASCQNPGYVYRVCKVCGYDEIDEIPRAGHSWGIEPSTNSATCFSVGVAVYVCEVCGEEESRASAAIRHHYVNGKCTMCGRSGQAETTKPVETTQPGGSDLVPGIGNLTQGDLSSGYAGDIALVRRLLALMVVLGVLIVAVLAVKRRKD